MSLNDIVNELEKQASNESNDSGDAIENSEYTEEQIKEAYAAGRVTGAAFTDRIQELDNNTNA